MNKLTRGLMSGASFAALSLGSITVAEAGHITVAAPTGAVLVTAAQVFSYISVTTGGDVVGGITNDGVVGVGSAFGISINGTGKVSNDVTTLAPGDITNNHIIVATQTGIFIGAAADVQGNVTNNGSLVVSRNGGSVGLVSGIYDQGGLEGGIFNTNEIIVAGNATAGTYVGVEQTGTHADFTNTGQLKVTGNNGAALGAFYTAVHQDVSGAALVEASITNGASGSIKVDVATNVNIATATVDHGIYQRAAATAGAASVGLDNSGLIEISAKANGPLIVAGIATDKAFVNTGIYQHALGVNTVAGPTEIDASVALTNESTGTINILANADVVGITSAHAYASIDTGISQYAHVTQNAVAGAQEGDAVVALTNNGQITIGAHANATANKFAFASASISGTGIYQEAANGDNVSISLTNSLGATLNIDATAVAHGVTGKATAEATVSRGIEQYATAGGDHDSSSAALINDGTLNIHAVASAVGNTHAFASASVNTGVSDSAYGGYVSTASLTNTGLLDIRATAFASAAKGATASAYVDYGITQTASGFTSAGSSASASITNSSTGTINIVAAGTAKGGTDASASATVYVGISQSAYGADSVSGVVDNAGTLNIEAIANAHAGSFASASASVEYGIYQNIAASNNDVSSSATITNESGATLNIESFATATGGTDADAYAYNYYAVEQYASNGDASVAFNNAGTVNILADAHANAIGSYASASAYIYTGIYQDADGSSTTTATATLTNSSTGVLNIESLASAHGGTGAEASAYISNYGIYQSADGALTSTVTLTNAGQLNIEAVAHATGGTSAYAYASVSTGIYQTADAYNTTGGVASVSLDNQSTGTLNIIAQATGHADGGTDNDAYAYIDSEGIYQTANGETASVSLSNEGTLNIEALARAVPSTAAAVPASEATAYAYIDTGIYQEANATGNKLSAVASLTNAGTLNIIAQATATGATTGSATAYNYYGISQDAYYGENTSVTLDNAGTLNIEAVAHAHATTGHASAYAQMYTGIYQYAYGPTTSASAATASLTNESTGVLNIEVVANAHAQTSASAYAYLDTGIAQYAYRSFDSKVMLDNSGSINILASAYANSLAGSAYAHASASTGIHQFASAMDTTGSSASASLTNASSGTINIGVDATALGGTEARAYASITSYGILQRATGADTATVSLNNSGTINIDVTALADPSGLAFANAHIGKTTGYTTAGAAPQAFSSALGIGAGIFQEASASYNHVVASVDLTNSGHITIDVNATATGGTSAKAYGLIAAGVSQIAENAATASASLTNSGHIDIDANANASAASTAFASANVHTGIYQYVSGDGSLGSSAAASLTNSSTGVLNIHANAAAVGSTASAYASVSHGIYQEAENATTRTVSIDNSGTIDVAAKAIATATSSAYAYAFAEGARQNLPNGGAESFTNSGNFTVAAEASATGSTARASAYATGLEVRADNGATVAILNDSSGVFNVSAIAHGTTGTASAYGILAGDNTVGGTLTGTIENDGHLNVIASAPGSAYALGIGVRADEFTGTITNKGTIHVAAVGTSPSATGIAISSNGAPTGLGVGTVVNDGGTMWVGVSNDGITFFRSDAMFLRNAPNTINVDLKGNGDIYGNIDLAAGDTVTVSGGKTKFDGLVNDNLALVGTVVISADGTLELANGAGLHNAAEAPAQVYADTYIQAGTLELEITPTPVAVPPTATTTAGFIKATNVTLSGGVLVDPDFGLYGNSTTYQTIFSATPISGTWSSVVTTTGTPLLIPTASYPTAFEADIVLTRVAFNAVGGLTPNEISVAGGLENAYSTSLTGAAALLYEGLFGVNAAQYPRTLDMLSGEEAGELSQLNVDAADTLTNAVTSHLHLENVGNTMTAALPQKVNAAMGGSAPITIWGGLYGVWDNTKDTISGPGYRASNTGLIAGVDTAIDRNTTIGLAFNYTNNGGVHFNDYGKAVGNRAEYDGFQIGAYGRYNADENYYLQALISYGSYNDKTLRFISLPAPFGSGVALGKFTSDVFAVYGEGGMNIYPGGSINITPYLAFGYTNASSGAYTETGIPGANLAVSDASSTSLSSFLGVKLDMTGMVGDEALTPTLKLAWRHNFDSNVWTVNAAFDGLAGSGFSVNGRDLSKDSLAIGAGLGYAIDGNVSAMLNYEGDLSSDRVTQSVMGRIKIQLGEEAAPPPPPPPAPPPPPPPPPPPVKTFIVFFDFDKSDLTDKAQEVVAEAVRTAKAGGFVKVLVTGHTDTVGSDSYNQALSIRRAQSVKDEMVHEGLDGSGIAIEGKSFHDPLVPTGPGVREPQNRRAVIDLGG